MAIDFVKADTQLSTQRYAQKLLQYARLYRETMDLGDELKGVMDHNTNGSVYTAIETLFGLQVGEGSVVYNLVAGSIAALKGTAQSADGMTLIDRVGG